MARDWCRIDFPAFNSIRSSGHTYELTRPFQLDWARGADQVQRLFVYALATDETVPSATTTAQHVARLLSERYDPKDEEPWNYDWYAVVQTSEGELYQSGPHPDVDFGHQLSKPPDFLGSHSRFS